MKTTVTKHTRRTKRGRVQVKRHSRILKNKGAKIPWSEFEKRGITFAGTNKERQILRRQVSKQPELLSLLEGGTDIAINPSIKTAKTKVFETRPIRFVIVELNPKGGRFGLPDVLRHEAVHVKQFKEGKHLKERKMLEGIMKNRNLTTMQDAIVYASEHKAIPTEKEATDFEHSKKERDKSREFKYE